MPALRIKDFRIPELHLPEMTRDDIAKALGDARKEIGEVRKDLGEMRRDIDLSKIDLTKVEMPSVQIPKIDLSRIDVPKAVTGAAQAAGLVKKPRSRMPVVIGALITLALVAWALLNSPGIKARAQSAAHKARERMDEMRATSDELEPRAFDAASPLPVESAPFSGEMAGSDNPFDGPSPLPEGLGDANGTHAVASRS